MIIDVPMLSEMWDVWNDFPFHHLLKVAIAKENIRWIFLLFSLFFRSHRQQVICKKGVLKNFAKFARVFFLIKLQAYVQSKQSKHHTVFST